MEWVTGIVQSTCQVVEYNGVCLTVDQVKGG